MYFNTLRGIAKRWETPVSELITRRSWVQIPPPQPHQTQSAIPRAVFFPGEDQPVSLLRVMRPTSGARWDARLAAAGGRCRRGARSAAVEKGKRVCPRRPFRVPQGGAERYDAAIVETARLTDNKRELTEEQKSVISKQLFELQNRLKTDSTVTVTFFEPDARKAGGSYKTITGAAKRVDEYLGVLELSNGIVIPFDDIMTIE